MMVTPTPAKMASASWLIHKKARAGSKIAQLYQGRQLL